MKKFTLSVSKKLFQTVSIVLAFTAIAAASFTSCENFLNGSQVKDEIISVIDYNNSRSYTINVDAKTGDGVVKTPATGEVEKKVTDTFIVRFEPAEDHVFLKWEAVVQDLSSGEHPSDYIQFENAESLETRVTLKKGSPRVIVIRPVCPQRLTYTLKQGGGKSRLNPWTFQLYLKQKTLFRVLHPLKQRQQSFHYCPAIRKTCERCFSDLPDLHPLCEAQFL